MAREAYRSLYGDLTKLKDDSLLDDPAGGSTDDDELFQLLMAVSDAVDRYCNRHFYPLTTTRIFDGSGTTQLVVPDLLAITTLKADDDEDKTFEVTWAANDYWLYPANAEPATHWGGPYSRVQVRGKGTKKELRKGEQNFQIVGRWGYRELKEVSGSLVDMASGITATATTLTVDSGGHFAAGQTIMVESEQMLITTITGNNLTVARALNGTTGASHADNTIVYILRWPLPVERATLLNAARIWTRAPAFEPFYVDADLDTDVRWLLDPFRLLPA